MVLRDSTDGASITYAPSLDLTSSCNRLTIWTRVSQSTVGLSSRNFKLMVVKPLNLFLLRNLQLLFQKKSTPLTELEQLSLLLHLNQLQRLAPISILKLLLSLAMVSSRTTVASVKLPQFSLELERLLLRSRISARETKSSSLMDSLLLSVQLRSLALLLRAFFISPVASPSPNVTPLESTVSGLSLARLSLSKPLTPLASCTILFWTDLTSPSLMESNASLGVTA